jgi:integrase
MAVVREIKTTGKWQAIIRRKGAPSTSRVFKTEAEARTWADQHEGAILATRAEVKQAGSTSPEQKTLAEVAALYFKSPSFLSKATTTQRTETQKSVAVLRLLGSYYIDHITVGTLQLNYFDVRSVETHKGRPIAGHTIRLEKALLSSLFNFAARRSLVKQNVLYRARFDFTRPKGREIRISLEDQARILTEAQRYGHKQKAGGYRYDANTHAYSFLMFLFQTGMRPGEASRIKLEWISKDLKSIAIPSGSTKNRSPRIVLLHEYQRTLVESQSKRAKASGSPYLFYALTLPANPYPYTQPLKAIFKRAGLAELVPHGIRHELVSRLFENGRVPEALIPLFTGHDSPASLEAYKHLRVEKHRDVFEDFSQQQAKEAFRARLKKPAKAGETG